MSWDPSERLSVFSLPLGAAHFGHLQGVPGSAASLASFSERLLALVGLSDFEGEFLIQLKGVLTLNTCF